MVDWLNLLSEKLQRWYIHFVKMLPNVIVAALIIIASIYIAKSLRQLTKKIINRLNGQHSGSSLVATMVYLTTIFVGLFFALDVLQLDKAVTSLLAGAGILGLALGFAFQDLTANLIAGVYITFKKPFEAGHTVETNGFIGNIEDIQLRSTTIITFSGLHILVPNKDIFQKPMINYSLTAARRIELNFAVSQDSDFEKVLHVSKAALEKIDYLFKEKPVEVYFSEIGEGTIKIAVWFWISNHLPPGYTVAKHDALVNLANAYHENGISFHV